MAKYTEKAVIYTKTADKIAAEILTFGGTLSEAKIEQLHKMQAADEAKAKQEELAAEEAEALAAKATAKRHALLALLATQRAALEAQIVIDEEAVAAEGL